MIIQNVISGTTVCYGDLAAALTTLRKTVHVVLKQNTRKGTQ